MTRKLTFITATVLLAAGLGACSRSAPDPAPVENEPALATPEPEPSAAPAPTPPAPIEAEDANTAVAIPPPTDPAADEQMMDDASATGMTARASRGDHSSEDRPAEDPSTTEPPPEEN